MPELLTPDVLSWDPNLEAGAVQQATNVAKLPFVAKPVAVMADGHQGYGVPVGSVIATDGAIIPYAVGVDIGCFVGDTKVPLLDGRQETLKNLVGRDPFWVYSLDENHEIVAGLATAHLTRQNAGLMRVIISGGEEIVCTPDHQFMLRDGTYREAKDLKFNDSLMPLYRKWSTRDGYESAHTGTGDGKMTHVRIWEQFNGPAQKGDVVHHLNHCHFDNRIENLTSMTAAAHSAYHRSVGKKFDNSDLLFQEKRLEGMRVSNANPIIKGKRARVGTENITRYMEEHHEEWIASVAGNGERGAPFLAKANVSTKVCDDCGEESKNLASHRWHKQREHAMSNHKVISVEITSNTEDVYCLNVPEFGNFALAAGVFVHNCGMIAMRLNLTSNDLPDDLGELHGLIRKAVPSGVGQGHEFASDWDRMRHTKKVPSYNGSTKLTGKQINTITDQMGTLGAGNHFVEVCLDELDRVWLVLHSGSRGIGNQLATYHIKIAKTLMQEMGERLPDPDLAYFLEGNKDFNAYIADLLWAQSWALQNREVMMNGAFEAVQNFMNKNGFDGEGVKAEEKINCHHNFTAQETYDGKRLWVTRKGAIKADKGDRGVIPGSMGAASFITTGLGNPQSFNSSSHGAGRRLSRGAAKKTLTVEGLNEAMAGKSWNDRDAEQLLDESPLAYKSIDEVMENQKELTRIDHRLHQILNYKGVK
jgi:tRNA-splicing ligase RtcB